MVHLDALVNYYDRYDMDPIKRPYHPGHHLQDLANSVHYYANELDISEKNISKKHNL